MEALQPDCTEWGRFYRCVNLEMGLDLEQYKPNQLRRRILNFAERQHAQTLDALWHQIAVAPDGFRRFTDQLAINVTEFYRDPIKWEELKDRVLPELLDRKDALKCWSAGCSFGAEARTLGTILDVHFPAEHNILGTDIDRDALDRAVHGAYTPDEMQNVPHEVARTYFEPGDRPGVLVARPIPTQSLVFKEGNLLKDSVPGSFDLIICRNVLIYLTDSAKQSLGRRFYRALAPGGVLFLGDSERFANMEEIGFSSRLPGFCWKQAE